MKQLKYIFESTDYSFESLFNKVKIQFPEFNLIFDNKNDGKIIIKFDGKQELTSNIVNNVKKIIQFLKDNHYEIRNPLDIYVKFKSDTSYGSGRIEEENDLLKLIGKKELLSIEFHCVFVNEEALDENLKELREMQRDIKSNKINLIPFNSVLMDENGRCIYDDENKCYKYKYTTLDDVLKDCPNFNYDGKEYWFLNSSIYNQSKTITEYGNNYLVTKINNEYNVIGYISVSFTGNIPGKVTKYSIGEILILPKFRRKGYSFIMNKFVQ